LCVPALVLAHFNAKGMGIDKGNGICISAKFRKARPILSQGKSFHKVSNEGWPFIQNFHTLILQLYGYHFNEASLMLY